MAPLGFLIKQLLRLKYKLTPAINNPERIQQKQLVWLLKKAKDTAFGQHYGFREILASKDIVAAYQQKIPVFEYDRMHEEWWHRQQVEENITWKGKPDYFALSSGTTGSESKRIPVTYDMIDCICSVGRKQIESLVNFDLAPKLFEKGVLMLGSSTNLTPRNGHLEGEITGISAGNLPAWFKGYYKPGAAISGIVDWDTKAQKIAEKAHEWDIVAISGIPFWIILMLKKIIAYNNLETIHDIWPNLTIYTTGGVAFEPYRESLNRLTARPLQIMDTYLASEGFLAYNARPDTMSMRLAIDNNMFFEFVPLDERGFDDGGNLIENPLVLTFSELAENKEYALLITTPAGAWRYMIGDTIKFTSLKDFEIILSGRTKYFLNVIGAQLTEEKMTAAISQLAIEMGVEINEYAVSALPDYKEDYYHQWVLGTNIEIDNKKAAKRLDEILQGLNHNYGSSRSKVLKYVTLKTIPSNAFYTWLAKGKKRGGQMKVPKVMQMERMKDLIHFIDEEPIATFQKRA